MPSMSFCRLPGPSQPHHTSNRCSCLHGCRLCLLTGTLPKHRRTHKLHNRGGGQLLSPPQVTGPGVEQGIIPAAKPGATPPARPGTVAEARPRAE